MRWVGSMAALLALAGSALADDVRVDRIEVVSKGVFDVEAKQSADTTAPGDKVATPLSFQNIEETSEIPAAPGLEFGMEYRIVGAPDGAEVPLEVVVTFPTPGLPDPSQPDPVRTSHFKRTKSIGETTYVGYGFDQEWEMVPGTWTFLIFYDNRKLVEESFTVTTE